ncbi:MAG: sigma-70 family RNA polymerase sigma factor [Thermodesulfobacteriota bacterium]
MVNNTGQVGNIPACLYDILYNYNYFSISEISMTNEYSDEELLNSIKDGDKSAFNEILNRHTNRFYRIAYRVLSDRDDAEDVVQEAFLKLWNSPGIWKSGYGAKFSTWFYKIVINLCLDIKRRKSRSTTEIDKMQLISNEDTPSESADKRERQLILNSYINELPERQQTALNLCFYEGISNKEAAEIMGINLKALESLLMRAKAALRYKFSKRGA